MGVGERTVTSGADPHSKCLLNRDPPWGLRSRIVSSRFDLNGSRQATSPLSLFPKS